MAAQALGRYWARAGMASFVGQAVGSFLCVWAWHTGTSFLSWHAPHGTAPPHRAMPPCHEVGLHENLQKTSPSPLWHILSQLQPRGQRQSPVSACTPGGAKQALAQVLASAQEKSAGHLFSSSLCVPQIDTKRVDGANWDSSYSVPGSQYSRAGVMCAAAAFMLSVPGLSQGLRHVRPLHPSCAFFAFALCAAD